MKSKVIKIGEDYVRINVLDNVTKHDQYNLSVIAFPCDKNGVPVWDADSTESTISVALKHGGGTFNAETHISQAFDKLAEEVIGKKERISGVDAFVDGLQELPE